MNHDLSLGNRREVFWDEALIDTARTTATLTLHQPHAPRELSLYAFEGHWGGLPAPWRRYAVRIDGFVSYRATYKPCRVTLKPIIFAGRRLSLNFASSAAGSIIIHLHAEGKTLRSVEMFGDSLDRSVVFEDGGVAALAGKPVTMEIDMRDADIYSFRFDDAELDS